MTIKIVTVIGARPQFIKAASVTRAIKKFNDLSSGKIFLAEKIIHTGQHYDDNMSCVFFEQLEIPEPVRNLNVRSETHAMQTGQMLEKIEAILLSEKPDYCIVYGDTNSTLAGALAAAKLHFPVAHVEAGLRSFNKRMPEEINRLLTDHISQLLFCPTDIAVDNLKAEGIKTGVYKTGDVMYDSIIYYSEKAHDIAAKLLRKYNIQHKSFYLATIHRAENTDDKNHLSQIVQAFNKIALPDCPLVLPLHPRTVKYITKYKLNFSKYVKILEPLSYLEMLALEQNAKIILTDSGGIQKEAFCFAVPCITLRNETEWLETVEVGCNILTGTDTQKIIQAVQNMGENCVLDMQKLYGDGKASEKIVEILINSIIN
jgi:UDP-N-acetylglucosamine 2-epimerase